MELREPAGIHLVFLKDIQLIVHTAPHDYPRSMKMLPIPYDTFLKIS